MRRAYVASVFSKGVLDKRLSERVDLAHFHQSLQDAENGIVYAQGGIGDRGGFELVGGADVYAAGVPRRLRERIVPVHLTAGMITAPNGGTASHLVDQAISTDFVTSAVTVSPFTVCEIDFGVALDITFVDVMGYMSQLADADQVVGVDYWDGAQWIAIGGQLDNPKRKGMRANVRRTRRFGGWPGQFISTRHLRIALVGGEGCGTFTLSGIAVWREHGGASPVELITVDRDDTTSYQLVISDRNIDVFRRQRWQAAIPIPVDAQQVESLNKKAAIDTVFLFHGQVPTPRIVRQGGDGEWDVSVTAYSNTPSLTAGAAFVGAQNEIQRLTIAGLTAGDQIVLHAGRRHSAPLTVVSDAAFAAAAASALDAVLVVAGGSVKVEPEGGGKFLITMTGAAGNRAWPLISAAATNVIRAVTTEVVQAGMASADAKLFSDTTGWPSCGTLAQSRLLVAGFRGAPSSWATSRAGNYFDFQNTADPLSADLGFVRSLEIDQVEQITDIVVGKNIALVTRGSEWVIETRVLDATQPVNVVLAGRNGAEPGVPAMLADGMTCYVQSGGGTLRGIVYNDTEAAYNTEPLTILAPHLLRDVVDLAHRPARSGSEGNLMFLVNGDGTIAAVTLLRGQDIIATIPWTTPDGEFRRIACDNSGEVYGIVARAGALYLERWRPDLPLDGMTHVTGTALTTIGNLGMHEGKPVFVYADRDLYGPFTVTDGAITLPEPADDVYVGREPVWRAVTQPVRERANEAQPFRDPQRIFEVELSLEATGAISLGTNGKTPRSMTLAALNGRVEDATPLETPEGSDLALPMLDRLLTGNRRLQGLTGWTEHPYIELTRPVPVPVLVKAIRYEVASHG